MRHTGGGSPMTVETTRARTAAALTAAGMVAAGHLRPNAHAPLTMIASGTYAGATEAATAIDTDRNTRAKVGSTHNDTTTHHATISREVVIVHCITPSPAVDVTAISPPIIATPAELAAALRITAAVDTARTVASRSPRKRRCGAIACPAITAWARRLDSRRARCGRSPTQIENTKKRARRRNRMGARSNRTRHDASRVTFSTLTFLCVNTPGAGGSDT